MTLASGTRLGPYEITAPLGAGGMGEVYRARDMRLERTVAVKILPASLSSDPVRKQRFEREAKAISSLNHPHICVLYDVGQQDGVDYLVMECVEGETLAKRLEKGPLPLEQVLKYGAQIADALDKAHRSGIVHRDLKPGNIMLTSAGAKLLDFGLARPVAPLAGAATLTGASPNFPVTERGTIVGTFQYMSPEQIEGKELDGRSDIFSLGAVLFEMLTGQRAFEGKSQLSVASAILEKEPPAISSLKPMTPPALDHTIRRCLAKGPEQRWQSAADLSCELLWIAQSGSHAAAASATPGKKSYRERLLIAALGVTAAAVAVALWFLFAKRIPAEVHVTRAHIKPMANSGFMFTGLASGFALSPDGLRLAYVASTPEGKALLWVRSIDSLQARSLPGTDAAGYPFWSPDSRFIGFFAGGKLKKIEPSGGPPVVLCDASDGRGGAWNREGDILFTPAVNAPIYRVTASGGPVVAVTALGQAKNEISHRWPHFLPDGRHFLYLAGSAFSPRENPTNAILVGSLDSKESKSLVHTHANAMYASGQILFLRLNTLMAQPFDAKKLELTGEAIPIADPVEEDRSVARGVFSVSENGLLTYVEGANGADRQLVWFDRSGKQVGAVPGADAYAAPRVSPDGKRIAFYLDSPSRDVWSYDLTHSVKAALTFGSASGQGSLYPVWSPDSRQIAYASYRNGAYGLYKKASDGSGSEEVLLEGENQIKFVSDWSPDGNFLAYHEASQSGWAIWMLPFNGDRKPYRFRNSEFSEREPNFSPDGKWLAYCSNESGEYKTYVVPFPGPGGKWQVSPGGGCNPRWRRDGKEIFYFSPDNKVMSADVRTSGSKFEVGAIHTLFETRSYGIFGRYDVTADGQRFIVLYEAAQPTAAVTLVVNWDAELKKK
ncbi:MAG TPA: protein kinase [Candidatus Acidoferrum sp.]|jgi:Tol biopolymer transport system component